MLITECTVHVVATQEGTGMQDVDNVRVVVRCRPFDKKELDLGCKLSVQVTGIYLYAVSVWLCGV